MVISAKSETTVTPVPVVVAMATVHIRDKVVMIMAAHVMESEATITDTASRLDAAVASFVALNAAPTNDSEPKPATTAGAG